MSPVGWALLAGAVLLAPLGTRPAAAGGATSGAADSAAADSAAADSARPARRPARRSLLPAAVRGPAFAGCATGAACVVAAGLRWGLVLAGVCCPLVWTAIRRAQRRPARGAALDPAVPLVLDLVAAALRAGRPLPDALALAAPAGRADTAETLHRVAGLCRLGADARQAWSIVPRDGPLAAVAPVAVRSAASGSKLAAACERLAAELRAERTASAAARAHRAGVSALAPLAACFLPSFVCLGVIPVVVGVARTSLGLLP